VRHGSSIGRPDFPAAATLCGHDVRGRTAYGHRAGGGWTRGSSTSSTINDSGWDAPCDAGDGTYDYALQAIGHARAYDGTDVGGPLLTGNSGRYNCGT
jgi:hypothetical protein